MCIKSKIMTTASTPNTSLKELSRALSFSALKHRDQRRLDVAASPYINHPIALLEILTEAGVTDTATLAGALLHDTVEDTDTSLLEVEESFSAEISHLVAEVSDDKSLPKEERKFLQVFHAATLSPKAKLIKLADKIANLTDIAANPPISWTLTRKRKYFDWAKEVVTAIGGSDDPSRLALVARFDRAYSLRP